MADRRIKFRAWDSTRGRMAPCDVYSEAGEVVRVRLQGDTHRSMWNVALMQYTGLLDTHGVEIYEGDIVVRDRYPWFDEGVPGYRDTVEWIYSQWQVVHHCVNPAKRGIGEGINVGLNDDGVDEGERTAWEVIGNIHEHPHLLDRGTAGGAP